jgi:alpha-1,6-mannosyltransferase
MSSASPAIEQPRVKRGWRGSRPYAGGDPALVRWVPLLAGLLMLALLASTAEVVLDGALAHSALIPKSPPIADWLVGIGGRLTFRVFLVALLVFTGAYAGMLGIARWLSARWVLVLLVALHAIVFVGPILFSTDVFSYIAYARMGVEHGINPYLHGPAAIAHDPVYRYVGHSWKQVESAYGPLYTLLSYPLAPLGVTGALWGMKVEALLASAGTLALTWRCARLRDLNPTFAVLAVGANPLYIFYCLGGAHNDLIMMLLMIAAVWLTLAERDGSAAASVVGATLVKATAAVLLPFMVLGRRRIGALVGAAAAALIAIVVGYAVFGIHGVDLIAALNRNASFVSTDSFPTEVAHLFGKPGVFPIDHTLLKVALVLIVLHLMWRTWRGYDWVAASGWALLAIAVTSTWLLAWYTLWSLPLAVVTRDRRLLVATLAIQALFIVHQTSPLFVQVA